MIDHDRLFKELLSTFEEEVAFNQELSRIEKAEQEQVMEIVTSWMEKGIAQGLEQGLKRGLEQGLDQGRREGELKLLLRLLTQWLGVLPEGLQAQVQGLTESQIEQLGDRLSTLTTTAELADWLNALEAAEGFIGLWAEVLDQLRHSLGVISPGHKQALLRLSERDLQALQEDSSTFAISQDLEDWLERMDATKAVP